MCGTGACGGHGPAAPAPTMAPSSVVGAGASGLSSLGAISSLPTFASTVGFPDVALPFVPGSGLKVVHHDARGNITSYDTTEAVMPAKGCGLWSSIQAIPQFFNTPIHNLVSNISQPWAESVKGYLGDSSLNTGAVPFIFAGKYLTSNPNTNILSRLSGSGSGTDTDSAGTILSKTSALASTFADKVSSNPLGTLGIGAASLAGIWLMKNAGWLDPEAHASTTSLNGSHGAHHRTSVAMGGHAHTHKPGGGCCGGTKPKLTDAVQSTAHTHKPGGGCCGPKPSHATPASSSVAHTQAETHVHKIGGGCCGSKVPKVNDAVDKSAADGAVGKSHPADTESVAVPDQ